MHNSSPPLKAALNTFFIGNSLNFGGMEEIVSSCGNGTNRTSSHARTMGYAPVVMNAYCSRLNTFLFSSFVIGLLDRGDDLNVLPLGLPSVRTRQSAAASTKPHMTISLSCGTRVRSTCDDFLKEQSCDAIHGNS